MDKVSIFDAFVVVCILYFFSVLLQLDSLEVLVKPLFLPVLFWYYLKQSNGVYELKVVFSFIFYYVAEMIVLLYHKQYYLYSGFLFLLPYIILLYYVILDFLILIKNNKYKKIDFIIFFVFVFFLYLIISIFLIIESSSLFEKFLYYAYGIVLLVLSVLSIINYYLNNSKSHFFLLLTSIAIIVTNLFYVIIEKFEYNWVYNFVKLISQLFSYYFFVCYCIFNVKEKNTNETL